MRLAIVADLTNWNKIWGFRSAIGLWQKTSKIVFGTSDWGRFPLHKSRENRFSVFLRPFCRFGKIARFRIWAISDAAIAEKAIMWPMFRGIQRQLLSKSARLLHGILRSSPFLTRQNLENGETRCFWILGCFARISAVLHPEFKKPWSRDFTKRRILATFDPKGFAGDAKIVSP